MVENSAISWTDHTFNPWIGCQKVGPGCDHCYAEALAGRFNMAQWGPDQERRRTQPHTWLQPRRWNAEAYATGRRARVFCASMADVFDNAVPADWRMDLFDLIRETPHLDWILLTKRIGNVATMLPSDWGDHGWPHVWLMITVVNQTEANRDIPKLLDTPATLRGLSIEPQLGAIDLTPWLHRGDVDLWRDDPLAASMLNEAVISGHGWVRPAVYWVICGAESGPGARPFQEDWARSLRDQCQIAGVPFFYKQKIVNGRKVETPDLDGHQHIAWPMAKISPNRMENQDDV